jgi:5'-nucleotidase
MTKSRSIILASAVALTAAGSALAAPTGQVDIQILAVNDFHGNLQPPTGSSGRVTVGRNPTTGAPINVDAGGVEYLATHIANLRALNPNTVVVSAGDMIGASPLLSALFHDEPTIEAFNYMGLDFNAVGNHEFDEGIQELIRMQEGGCHPVDGCLDGDGFEGAQFRFLAANVLWKKNGKPVFPAYKIRAFNGVQVAFIGMTLEGTPSIVSPSGISALKFMDEADTVNALIPELKQRGVEAIVVVVHEGGLPTGLYNECPAVSGAIVDIVNRLNPEVDLVISGHTHQAYNCRINDIPVTSASSFGRVVTKIDLTIDRTTRDVVDVATDNRIVTRDVPKDPLQSTLVTKYNAIAAPLANRIIGSITADITTSASPAGESALGDVVADAQLEATRAAGRGDAVIAFMNPGGIRANLTYAGSAAGEGDGNVTYGEVFTVQPFGNSLVTLTLTGAQIDTLLEQQFPGCGQAPGTTRILQVSSGFSYSWSVSAPACSKVDPASIKLGGATIDPNASYRVTVNSFLADGGDSFSVLVQGTNRLGGDVDVDAFEDYLAVYSPVPPGPQNRITRLP